VASRVVIGQSDGLERKSRARSTARLSLVVDEEQPSVRCALARTIGPVNMEPRSIAGRRPRIMPTTLQQYTGVAPSADVVDSMIEAFYAYDADLRFLRVNRAARARMERSGIDPDAVIGRSLLDVYPSVRGTIYERSMRQVLETRAPAYFTERDLVVGQWLDVRIVPTTDGVAAYVHDVSARVLADRQRDLLLRVGELVSASLDPLHPRSLLRSCDVPR
jgi:PAS domain-containing protein